MYNDLHFISAASYGPGGENMPTLATVLFLTFFAIVAIMMGIMVAQMVMINHRRFDRLGERFLKAYGILLWCAMIIVVPAIAAGIMAGM